MRRIAALTLVWAIVFAMFARTVRAQEWKSLGPEGGDVRLLVADPRNAQTIYLGTSDGHLFRSTNGGARWSLLSRVGDRPDTVVMSLLVDHRDSKRIFVGTRTMRGEEGGLFRSTDGGASWKLAALRGQIVRAIAQSASQPDTFVAGTLDGVYRSQDSGSTWQRISPTGHADLLNFDSLAIDPQNPDVIYAGTYHLPWKTSDGGRTWTPIHTGMIDDSDVMSLAVDRWDSSKIFATACSGMYRSGNRGDLWAKIKGVPPTSRRTYFLHQHPSDPRTLYAGTTQGLWKSVDDGGTWKRMTPVEWSVIALIIDPKRPERLVAGTERRGVVISEDGGQTFRSSNQGFNHQQIMAFASDPERPERMLLVLTNAQERVLTTRDGGQTWTSIGAGFEPERMRHVFGAPGSWWASMNSGGLMTYDEKTGKWTRAGLLMPAKAAAPAVRTPATRSPAKKAAPPAKAAPAPQPRPLQLVVNDMAFGRDLWLAGTSQGILGSRDRGATWSEFSMAELKNVSVQSLRLSKDGKRMGAFTSRGIFVSPDLGQTWARADLPVPAEQITSLQELDDLTLVLVTRWGLFIKPHLAEAWRQAPLPDVHIHDAAVVGDTLLVSTHSRGLFTSTDRGNTWAAVETPVAAAYFPFLRPHMGDRGFVAASATESLHVIRVEGLRAARIAGNSPEAASPSSSQRAKSNQEQ